MTADDILQEIKSHNYLPKHEIEYLVSVYHYLLNNHTEYMVAFLRAYDEIKKKANYMSRFYKPEDFYLFEDGFIHDAIAPIHRGVAIKEMFGDKKRTFTKCPHGIDRETFKHDGLILIVSTSAVLYGCEEHQILADIELPRCSTYEEIKQREKDNVFQFCDTYRFLCHSGFPNYKRQHYTVPDDYIKRRIAIDLEKQKYDQQLKLDEMKHQKEDEESWLI